MQKGFSCSSCGKSYHRKEHLTRHERSHKAQRPYICEFCDRNFTRQDVLKRHLERHNLPQSRASRACDRCRARKCKCDGGDPCESCFLSGTTCSRQRFGPHHPQADQSPDELGETISATCFPSSLSRSSGCIEDPNATLRPDASCPMRLGQSNFHGLPEFHGPATCSPPGANSYPNLLSNGPPEMDSRAFEDFNGVPTLFGWDLMTDSILEPEVEFSLPTPLGVSLVNDHGHLTGRNNSPGPESAASQPWPTTVDTLPSRHAAAESGRDTTVQGDDRLVAILDGKFDTLPASMDESSWKSLGTRIYAIQKLHAGRIEDRGNETDDGDRFNDFIDIYFSRFHRSWPLLHRASFHKHLKHPLLVLSVIMIGSFLDENAHSTSVFVQLHRLLKGYLYKALSSFPSIRRWTLPFYQALVLNVIVGFLSADRNDAIEADLASGSLITAVRRLGFFKNKSVRSGRAVDDIESGIHQEERLRLVTTITKIDAYINVTHNRPSNISFEELDIPFPSHANEWNAGESDGNVWSQCYTFSRHYQTISDVVSDIINNEAPIVPLDAEDYQMVLCLLQSLVWKHIKSKKLQSSIMPSLAFASLPPPKPAGSEDLSLGIHKTLNRLRRRFDLFKSSSTFPGVIRSSTIEMTLFNSYILWHIDAIRLQTDLEMLQEVAQDMNSVPSEYEKRWKELHSWAYSASARESIWHAVQIWQLWNRYVNSNQWDPDPLCEPISYIGLFQSAVVVWSYTRVIPDLDIASSAMSTRDLHSNTNAPPVIDLALIEYPSADLTNWIEQGGVVYFNAIPLSQGSFTEGLLMHFEYLLSRRPRSYGVESRFLEILKQLRCEKVRTGNKD